MKNAAKWLTLAALAALVAPACGDYQGFSYQQYALEDQNGGFTVGTPAPQFVSDELGKSQVQELSYTADDGEEEQAESEAPTGKRVATLRLLWGQFPLNAQLATPTRWQGVVYAQGASVFIQRVIFYERQDFVRHCADRSCVVIDSLTLPHHDGLVLKIVPRPQISEPVRVFIGFRDLYGRVLRPDDIAGGFGEVAIVDELGNRVALEANLRRTCPGGTVQGIWKRIAARGGVFTGDWMNDAGEITGRLAGIWGRRANGEQVFFGVYGDAQRNFVGLLKGTYRAHPAFGGGRLAGHWMDQNGEPGGVLFGLYRDRPADGASSGGFMGRYRVACAGEALDPGDLPPECLSSGAEYCTPSGDGPICECAGSVCTCNEGPGTEGGQDPNLGNCDCSDAAEPVCACDF